MATKLGGFVFEAEFSVCLSQVKLCQSVTIFNCFVVDSTLIVVSEYFVGLGLQSVMVAIVVFKIFVSFIDLCCLAE